MYVMDDEIAFMVMNNILYDAIPKYAIFCHASVTSHQGQGHHIVIQIILHIHTYHITNFCAKIFNTFEVMRSWQFFVRGHTDSLTDGFTHSLTH